MTITVNHKSLNFVKCLGVTNSREEPNIWKSFIELDNSKIELEVTNEYEINWKGVVDFLEKLPNEINKLKIDSQTNLIYLARQMKFWKDDFESHAFFYLDAIEYQSVNLNDDRLNFSNFSNHTFQLIFTLESKHNRIIDTYGRWVTKWTGNQITGFEREQY